MENELKNMKMQLEILMNKVAMLEKSNSSVELTKSIGITSESNFNNDAPLLLNRKTNLVRDKCESTEKCDEDLDLENLIEQFYQKKADHNLASQKKLRTFNLLKKIIIKNFPTYKVKLFGSMLMGISSKNSDIDVAILTQNQTNNKYTILEIERKEIIQNLSKISEKLKLSCENFCNFSKPINAKIPLLKFEHSVSNISFDMICDITTGVKNSEFFKSFFEKNKKIKMVIFFLKEYLRFRNMNKNDKGISNFGLCVLMFSFIKSIDFEGSLDDAKCILMSFLEYFMDFEYLEKASNIPKKGKTINDYDKISYLIPQNMNLPFLKANMSSIFWKFSLVKPVFKELHSNIKNEIRYLLNK